MSKFLQLGCYKCNSLDVKILAKKDCKLPSFWKLIIQRLRLAFARMIGLSFQSILCVRSHSVFRSWLEGVETGPVPFEIGQVPIVVF